MRVATRRATRDFQAGIELPTAVLFALDLGPEFDFHMLQKPQHFSFESRKISTWRPHLYLPPVCAHDAAYGCLNGSPEASHAMCLEHQPSTVASKRRKIHLRIGTGARLHRRLGQLLGRHEAHKTTVEMKDD